MSIDDKAKLILTEIIREYMASSCLGESALRGIKKALQQIEEEEGQG